MLRPGRFKHRLLTDDFLSANAKLASQCVEPFVASWRAGEITGAEMAAAYIFIFSFLRRPGDFLGGPHNLFKTQAVGETASDLQYSKVLELLFPALPEDLSKAKSLKTLSKDRPFVAELCGRSLRSLPVSVIRSLRFWQSGEYNLKLLTYVPTAEEVLDMQSRGSRCVTMVTTADEISRPLEDSRDAFGFIVHDLIHADHFFNDPAKATAQIRFSRKLRDVHRNPEITRMFATDPVFQNEFHYLMSDMNSVPLHLLKTLKAVLLGHFKRRAGISMRAPLCQTSEAEFTVLFKISLDPWELCERSWEAALRLNSLAALPEDAPLLDAALSKEA